LRKNGISQSERTAIKIANLINDLTLDLDQVGYYLARFLPNTTYRRIIEIAEAAKHEKEVQNESRHFG
jgi:hypothetical protein